MEFMNLFIAYGDRAYPCGTKTKYTGCFFQQKATDI